MRRRLMVTFVTAAAMLATLGPSAARAGSAGSPAVSGSSGAQLWAARYNGRGNGDDTASSVAVSPAGTRVFVTGQSLGGATGADYATVAYSAATGRRLWVSRYNGPVSGDDAARSVAVSPGGTRVFVTGQSQGGTTGGDYATVAYSAATGRRLWVRRYNGPGNGTDGAVAVRAAGTRVFVSGGSEGQATGPDYATVAYSAATGRRLWVSRYNGPGNGIDALSSMSVSPTGARVFVTGGSEGGQATVFDYATVAYSAATGRQLWASRFNGPANDDESPAAVAVSPTGTSVFVTGTDESFAPAYLTVAYSAAAGQQLWVRRYSGAVGPSSANSVAVSPAGTKVFVTGGSWRGSPTGFDYATVAYSATTGRRLWVRLYNGPENGGDGAVAVRAAGTKVFVTGNSEGRTTGLDYATVAYRG